MFGIATQKRRLQPEWCRSQMKILVVEDSVVDAASLLIATAKVVTKFDWQMTLVSSLDKALKLIEKSDLVFLDLQLIDSTPENTVWKLVVPYSEIVSIVITTGSGDVNLKEVCERHGVVRWIEKADCSAKEIEHAIIQAAQVASCRTADKGIQAIRESAKRIQELNDK